MTRKKILIIGNGIVGLSVARSCLAQGHQVTIVDRNPKDHWNCSYGNAGYVSPSHFTPLAAPGVIWQGIKWMTNPKSPFFIRPRLSLEMLRWLMLFRNAATQKRVQQAEPVLRDLLLNSMQEHEAIFAELNCQSSLHRDGLLMLCNTQKTLEHEAHLAQRAAELGIEANCLSKTEIAELDPNIKYNIEGGVHYPGDAFMTPQHLMQKFESHLEAQGVEFLREHEVVGIDFKNRTIESLQAKLPSQQMATLSADEYVIASGVWSSELARHCHLRLPMEAGKGYSITIPQPPVLPKVSAILVEARVAVTPMEQALRIGGTMELGGKNNRVDRNRLEGIAHSACQYMPELNEQLLLQQTPWFGLRPCSPDGLPYIGRSKTTQNLIIAAGHAMLGLSLGPVTGRLVSEILSGEKPCVDLALLSPDRYQ